MDTRPLRADPVAYSARLLTEGLRFGTSDNLSTRADTRMLMTPSGIPAEELRPGQMVTIELNARIVDAPAQPSSELPLHLAVFNATDAGAVVHTHSPFATVLSTTVELLPHYTINGLGGPVRVVPYATFGCTELAEGVQAGLHERIDVIPQDRGTVTYGRTLAEAFNRARLPEWLATLFWRAEQIGQPRILDEDALRLVKKQPQRLRYAYGRES